MSKTRQFIRRAIPQKLLVFIRDLVYPEKINILEDRLNSLFLTHYRGVSAPDVSQKTVFRNAEFKVYSKHGCDGMLLYIFSKLGIASHTFIEIGVEDGRECNTANLSLNFGWGGLLVDANKEWVESAKIYYKTKLGSNAQNVKIAHCFVAAENINQLFLDNGFKGEIDLLSIDIDSNDYWVWEAINVINPRVVVIEYNSSFGLKSLVQKYNPDFRGRIENPLSFGASLSALTKLGKRKGYILVACDCHGHDAYFVRKDIVSSKFMESSPEEAYYPNPHTLGKFGSLEEQFKLIEHLDFVEV